MNLETIDIYFVHNPEIQLNVVPRQTVLSRIKSAFEAMEECVAAGKISMYGVASWNAFRIASSGKLSLSLEELVYFAKDVGKCPLCSSAAVQCVFGVRLIHRTCSFIG
jgi:aryl-alcohol dehydrogenase-like predicted oxidoreductase